MHNDRTAPHPGTFPHTTCKATAPSTSHSCSDAAAAGCSPTLLGRNPPPAETAQKCASKTRDDTVLAEPTQCKPTPCWTLKDNETPHDSERTLEAHQHCTAAAEATRPSNPSLQAHAKHRNPPPKKGNSYPAAAAESGLQPSHTLIKLQLQGRSLPTAKAA